MALAAASQTGPGRALVSIFKRFSQAGRNGNARHDIGAAGDGNFGVGAPYHQAWEFRPLPGAGANQWAWETLALPMYSPIGWGVRNRRQFFTNNGQSMVAVQGVTLAPLGGTPIEGTLTGQFVTAPLLDVTQAEASGMQSPAYQSRPNAFEMPNYSVTA
jgi:hypothetical protein